MFRRLSEDVKNRPLRELANDPTIMEREVERIRVLLHNKKSAREGDGDSRRSLRLYNFRVCLRPRSDATRPRKSLFSLSTVDPKRKDLPVLAEADMPAWWKAVEQIPEEVHREAHVFCLLSALRRNSLVELQWKDLDLKRRCVRSGKPKGGEDRAFDLILCQPMLRCLWRARREPKALSAHADKWVFASALGHVRGDSLTRDGVLANHALRRAYATAATNAGVDENRRKTSQPRR